MSKEICRKLLSYHPSDTKRRILIKYISLQYKETNNKLTVRSRDLGFMVCVRTQINRTKMDKFYRSMICMKFSKINFDKSQNWQQTAALDIQTPNC